MSVPESMSMLSRTQQLLQLDQLDTFLFRAYTPKTYLKYRIYGGQTLAQSLMAAYLTVSKDYIAISMHAMFIRAGNPAVPLLFYVKTIRNGKSFCHRNVEVVQNGKMIFTCIVCFQLPEKGWEHHQQMDMSALPAPEDLPSKEQNVIELITNKGQAMSQFRQKTLQAIVDHPLMFEYKPLDPSFQKYIYSDKSGPPLPKQEPVRRAWVRSDCKALPDDLRVHQCMLAYISDHGLMTTSLLPHGKSVYKGDIDFKGFASLDHSMWFHRPFLLDADWMLYETMSPQSAAARGLNLGKFYSRENGELVASTAQEGLVRPRVLEEENDDPKEFAVIGGHASSGSSAALEELPAYHLPAKL